MYARWHDIDHYFRSFQEWKGRWLDLHDLRRFYVDLFGKQPKYDTETWMWEQILNSNLHPWEPILKEYTDV